MVTVIFTLDYELGGNGEGCLKRHVFEPTQKIVDVFNKLGCKIVIYVEGMEFSVIKELGEDSYIYTVENQVLDIYKQGHELGLHIHPQWHDSKYLNGQWFLNHSNYNLCTLPENIISEIVNKSINCIRGMIKNELFQPVSFRAGNWLLQPSQKVVKILAEKKIKIDSSVFKGGLQHKHKLDYRMSLENGFFWKILNDVNIPDPDGSLYEVPIYTKMVPFWKMISRNQVNNLGRAQERKKSRKDLIYRALDFARPMYPKKFDFCRQSFDELKDFIDEIILEDNSSPETFKPIVLIGHSKDYFDIDSIEKFINYLNEMKIKVSTFQDILPTLDHNSKSLSFG